VRDGLEIPLLCGLPLLRPHQDGVNLVVDHPHLLLVTCTSQQLIMLMESPGQVFSLRFKNVFSIRQDFADVRFSW
jgi:hypothetical protein